MKRILIFLLLITGLAGTAQGTIPSYPGIKLTKLTNGAKEDSVLVVNGSSKTVKQLPTSAIKGTTNLDYTATPTGGTVYSSTGNDAALPLATTTNAGLLAPADKTKIDEVQSQLDAKENTSNKDNGTLTSSSITFPTSGAVKEEIDKIKSIINPNTYVVTDAGYSQSVNDITINAGWQWKINNVAKTNASPVVINIPVAASGYNRIDLIVLNEANTAVRVPGVEVVGTPSSPTVPVNTIQILFLTADSSTIGTPVIVKPKNQVSQTLRNGETNYSPSEDVVYDALAGKQAALVSGTNIKTINGGSILGSGDIAISGGGGGDMVLASAQTNTGVKTFLNGTFGFRNVANTFTSYFTNANTTTRTYTLPDVSGTIALLASPSFSGTVGMPIMSMGGTSKIFWGDDFHRIQYMGGNVMEIREFGILKLIAPSIQLNGAVSFSGGINGEVLTSIAQTGSYVINGQQNQGNGAGQVSALARFYNGGGGNSGFYLSTDANLRESGIATPETDNFNIICAVGKKIKFRRSTGNLYYGLKYTANESAEIAEFDSNNNFSCVGEIKSTKFTLSALNTAPSSATDTGTLGEVRITADYIYVCTATNTWVRTALATW